MAFSVSSRAKGVTVVPLLPDTKLSAQIQPQKEPVISLSTEQDVSNGRDLANEFNVDRRSDDIQKWDDYANGKVRYGTLKGYKRLINFHDKATPGTGMIQDESLSIMNDKFELGVNYRDTNCTGLGGGFGEVTKCQDLKTGHEFAIKKVKCRQFNKLECLIPEHRNVCRVLGIILQNPHIWLLLAWAGESLDKFLCGGRLCRPLIMDLFIQGLEALKHLHQHGLRHMDIKR